MLNTKDTSDNNELSDEYTKIIKHNFDSFVKSLKFVPEFYSGTALMFIPVQVTLDDGELLDYKELSGDEFAVLKDSICFLPLNEDRREIHS